MSWLRRAEPVCLAAIAVALAGCSDDGPTGTAGSIQVATDVATVSVPQGGSGSVTVTLTRNGGFSGAVTLAVSGLPAGITATVTPAQLSGTTMSATVNVGVAGTAALATHTATITATAPGVAQATAQFAVTITPTPSFGLRVAALTVAAGSTASTTINIDRVNFGGSVALTLLNAPAGITGVFNPSSPTSDAASLTVSAALSVAPGIYPITIQGTSSSLGVKITSLTLTVTPGGNAVEYQFCHADDVPNFFAYQDGTGVWQAVNGSTSGSTTRFVFTIAQGRGGVLLVYGGSSGNVASRARASRFASRQPEARWRLRGMPSASHSTWQRAARADIYETYVLYAATSELAKDGVDACVQYPPPKTVRGTIAGVPVGGYGFASFGNSVEIVSGGTASTPVTFRDVPPGNMDFIGARLPQAGVPPDRLIVVRNLDVADGAALPFTIDFNGPLTSLPVAATASISGGNGEDLEVYSGLVTANDHVGIYSDLAPSPNASRPWAGLASAALNSGDLHSIIVFGSPVPRTGDFRVTGKYVGPVADHSLALGPAIVMPTITQLGPASYPRLRFQGTLPPDYHKVVFIDVVSDDDAGNLFGMISTSAYLTATGNAIAYDFTLPDVAGLTGFPVAARLTPGAHRVVVSADGFNGPGLFELIPTLGTEFRAAIRSGTFTVH